MYLNHPIFSGLFVYFGEFVDVKEKNNYSRRGIRSLFHPASRLGLAPRVADGELQNTSNCTWAANYM